jgi:dihydrolipoamide dehydrogenase
MTSTEALEIEDVPENLLVVGGGYIGMEMGTVYAALGSKVTVVEALDNILAGADPDLARPVVTAAKKAFKEIRLKAKVLKCPPSANRSKWSWNSMAGKSKNSMTAFWFPLAGPRTAPTLGLENTKVTLDEKGFIKVNAQQQTSDPHIYAIGDIAGGILLAHKAHKEGASPWKPLTARVRPSKVWSFQRWSSPTPNLRGAV